MWIHSVRVDGGVVLNGFEQTFSNSLNVIIGGRGTGKSSIIELIRFCLDAGASNDAAQRESLEHALGVLGDGRVVVTLTDGKRRLEVARTAHDLIGDSLAEEATPFVFSQSEIESIGLRSASRIRLIDGFLPSRDHSKEERVSAAKVRSLTAEIRQLLAEIDDIEDKTAVLASLKDQLALVKSQSAAQTGKHKEVEGDRKALAELTAELSAARVRSEAIARSSHRLAEWEEEFGDLLQRRPTIEPWPSQAGGSDELAPLRTRDDKLARNLRALADEMSAISAELSQREQVAEGQRAGVENRAREVRQRLEEHQKGASVIEKQISDLSQQISVLNSLTELRQQRLAKVEELKGQRNTVLGERDASRQKVTKQRAKVAADLTKDLRPAIRVQIEPFSQRTGYVSALASALRGSGLRYTELAERIAETFGPQEIALLAEARDIDPISTMLSITSDRAHRLCNALRSDAGAPLFTTDVEDDAALELLDGADYKSIDFLSMGQRCTVILPIILRHQERTIVLDQPEDHLDNAFVVDTIIKAMINRQGRAQSIVATHNPNIPVLGDASHVIHMDSDGSRCFVKASGDVTAPKIVDAITTIMEGGRDAFAKRAAFYSMNNPNAATN